MSEEENKAVMRRILDDVYVGGQFDLLDELLSPNFVNHNVLGTGEAVDSIGIDKVKQELKGIHLAMSGITMDTIHLLAEGDYVVVYAISKGTHTGQFFGVPRTGKPVQTAAMTIARMEDGKMAERWNLIDLYGTLQQIGAIPGTSQS